MADCRQWLGFGLALTILCPSTSEAQQLDASQQAFLQGYSHQTGADGKKIDIELALRFYAQALRLRPQFYEAHANAGQIYYERRKYKRAIKHFTEAVRLARGREDVSTVEEARVSSNLGGCYFQQGQLKEAERWIRGAISLDPALVEAHYNLINLLLRHDRIVEARQHLAAAQQAAPSERYGIFVGRLQTKDSYASWNPLWLKVVIGVAAIVTIALIVFRAVGTARSTDS
ncbi:MAG: tetratricopeptide repeat protein [Candidatus Latescibacterota bacterium]|nr:tetratricopeptide repeat protein [Candidatus Latescibacterota bacterium]